jgi:hypothetical protein
VIGYPGLPRLDVNPRDAEDELRVKPSVLIPADGPRATVGVRRERLRTGIAKAMSAIGWELIATFPALKFKKSLKAVRQGIRTPPP